jgi:hypothetical protein
MEYIPRENSMGFETLKEGMEYFFTQALKYENKGLHIEAYTCLLEAMSWEFYSNLTRRGKK